MYSREIINMFFVGQMAGLDENFNTGICQDTVTVINGKLFMIAPLIELYLFIPLLKTLTIFQGHMSTF